MKTEEHIEAIARAAKDYADWRETFGEEKAWAQLKAAIRAAQPAGAQQPGAAYAEMPTHSHAGRVYEEGFLIGTCPLYTADKMRAFADATCAMRATPAQFARGFEAAKAQFASHGQAPAPLILNCKSEQKRLATLWGFVPAQADPLQPVVALQETAGMYADDFKPQADSVLEDAFKLLDEVAQCFTTDDGLPDNLLPRIDAVIAARAAQEGKTP